VTRGSDRLSARDLDALRDDPAVRIAEQAAIMEPMSSGTPTRPSAVMAASCG